MTHTVSNKEILERLNKVEAYIRSGNRSSLHADAVADTADLIETQAAEIVTLRAWADGPDGVRWYIDQLALAKAEIAALKLEVEQYRDALEAIKEFTNADDTFLAWQAANDALTIKEGSGQ